MNFTKNASNSILRGMELQHQKISLAIVYSILGALMYSLMSVFVRMASDQATTAMMLFIRFFVSILVLLPFVFVRQRRGTFHFKSNRWGLHLFRGLAAFLSLALYFLAIQYIPLVDAVLLRSTYPLFMPLIVWVALGTPSRISLLIAIALGFVGVVFVLESGSMRFHWTDFLALASGLLTAISILSVRQLNKTDRRINIMLNYFMLSIVITTIIAAFQWKAMNAETLLLLVLIGVTGVIYQYALTASLSHASARIVSPLMYLNLVFVGLLEWYLWDYVPGFYTLLGMVIIVGSGIAVVLLRDREYG